MTASILRLPCAKSTYSKLAVVLLALAALAGCARDSSDLERYISEVKARPAGPIEPIPEIKPFESFTYPEGALRDPFAPLDFSPAQASSQAGGPRPDPNRPREILEDFPLDTLRMVGILQQHDNLWALIRDPSGTIHRVQTNNYLGQNHGRIIEISERAVVLRELIPDGMGGWIEREASPAARE